LYVDFLSNIVPWPSGLRVCAAATLWSKNRTRRGGQSKVTCSFPWRLRIGDHVCSERDVGILSLAPVTIESMSASASAPIFAQAVTISTEDFKLNLEPITVRTGSWVAAAAFLGPCVEVGAGAVVAAGQASVFGGKMSSPITGG